MLLRIEIMSKNRHNVTVHGSPQIGEYGEFGSEKGIYCKGRVIEEMTTKKSKPRPPHSPTFAFLLFAIMLVWFYIATDMGKRTVDMPRDRVIHIYKD